MSSHSTSDSEGTPLLSNASERPRDVYDRFSQSRKAVILAIVSWSGLIPCQFISILVACLQHTDCVCFFCAVFVSGSFIPSIPQIVEDLHSTANIIKCDYPVKKSCTLAESLHLKALRLACPFSLYLCQAFCGRHILAFVRASLAFCAEQLTKIFLTFDRWQTTYLSDISAVPMSGLYRSSKCSERSSAYGFSSCPSFRCVGRYVCWVRSHCRHISVRGEGNCNGNLLRRKSARRICCILETLKPTGMD